MKKWTGLLSLVVFALLANAASGDDQAWTIGPREVPVPAGASPELQEIIGNWTQPDPARPVVIPTSEAGWMALIEETERLWATSVPGLLTELAVAVDREEIDGVKIHRITPAHVATENRGRVFVHLHGGSYAFGRGDAGIGEAILIAGRVQIPVLSIDYRKPPQYPFPAALEDVVTIHRHLLESYPADRLAIGGSSAGGGLALAAIHRFKSLELHLPGAVYAGTAWADLTKTGDTLFTNEGLDRILVTNGGLERATAKLYAGDRDLRDPLISPVYGDFHGFPPTLLVSGTRDMFLSDVARVHRKMRAAGVLADLHVYEAMSHAGYFLSPHTPESLDMYRELKAFLNVHLEPH